MRAPFDRLIDLYWGPDTATPGAIFAAEVPARVIPDEAFVDTALPLSESLAYITLDVIEPDGPTTSNTELQKWMYDYGKANTVALVAGGAITHQVLRVELRTWETGSSYWRAHICPLLDELPSVCSTTYEEEFKFATGGSPYVPLARIGPTTWVYEVWTLEAEVGELDPETCESHWVLTNGTYTWVTEYGGTGNQWFVSADGGTPTSIFLEPGP